MSTNGNSAKGAPTKVTIVGGGAWGVALAAAAARAGSSVLLYSRREQGQLPGTVQRSADLKEAAEHARLLVLAVPSDAVARVAASLGDHLNGSHYVVHGVRGLSGTKLDTISQVVRRETPVRRVGAIGGPAIVEDLVAGRPNVIVCGSRFPEVLEAFTQALGSKALRVYPTQDLVGLEWASALVGCLMIAVGFAQGLGMTPGLIAAFLSRSIGEAARIAAAAGGDEQTLLGLAGYGDLLAAASQESRPEVMLGHRLASGGSRNSALSQAKEHIEALELIPRIAAFCDEHKVRAPIFRALNDGIGSDRGGEALLADLMTQPMESRA